MDLEIIKAQILLMPEVAAWPELSDLLRHAGSQPSLDWTLPLTSCQSVGGDPSYANPAAAAIICMQISIILVDDMLDEDPRGEHLRLGYGRTANLAFALQSAAFCAIGRADIPADRRAAAMSSLASMALATAHGQDLDVDSSGGEDRYWQVVRAKSTPFYGAALHIGALLGGAEQETAVALRDLGILVGEVVQIHDDLQDAFQTPAKPDWKRPSNNLAILYAITAEHPDKAQFIELIAKVEDPQLLHKAQQVLIRCGAVSYCAYHLILRQRKAQQLLDRISLPNPEPIMDLVSQQMKPMTTLLEKAGVEIPPELLTRHG